MESKRRIDRQVDRQTDSQSDSRKVHDRSPDSTVRRKEVLHTFISSLSSAHAAPMSAALEIPLETSQVREDRMGQDNIR